VGPVKLTLQILLWTSQSPYTKVQLWFAARESFWRVIQPCSAIPSPYFQFSPKNINFKIFLTFFTFYITSTLFYYYLNKKTHYDTKFSLFRINSFNFISHQSHFTITKKKFIPYMRIGGKGVAKRSFNASSEFYQSQLMKLE
jgi:hypothetical protein